MKPQDYSLLLRTILLRMMLYAAIFSLFAFWEPLKHLAFGEPAQWTESMVKAKPFIVITVVFSILFGFRDYHKKRTQAENITSK